MTEPIDLSVHQSRQRESDARLQELEAADLRALVDAPPHDLVDGTVCWGFVRLPDPFETADEGGIVCVSARAFGLGLEVERVLLWSVSGAPMPNDQAQVAAMLRAHECLTPIPVPCSRDLPRVGLRLKVQLEETTDRARVVDGQGVRR